MGEFFYSHVKLPLDADRLDADLPAATRHLFGDEYRVERSEGVSTRAEDNRVAKWCFYAKEWDVDAAFTMSLLRDNRLEFKVPPGFGKRWMDQQRVRRHLVIRYNREARERSP